MKREHIASYFPPNVKQCTGLSSSQVSTQSADSRMTMLPTAVQQILTRGVLHAGCLMCQGCKDRPYLGAQNAAGTPPWGQAKSARAFHDNAPNGLPLPRLIQQPSWSDHSVGDPRPLQGLLSSLLPEQHLQNPRRVNAWASTHHCDVA